MSTFSAIFSSVFTASVILNAILFYNLKTKSKGAPKSMELKEFLSDLASGDGLIRVTRVDPSDVLIRSPRNH